MSKNRPAYRPRIVDDELARRLRTSGAVVIEGPRACGKTETARRISNSEVLLDIDTAARMALSVDPSLVLEGTAPRLIDEWQIDPSIWDHIRRVVDSRRAPGQFVLTGSSVPTDDARRHSGAGRFSTLRMRPMSLFESGHSTGAISLEALLSGGPARSGDPGLSIAMVADRIVVGGWPMALGMEPDEGAAATRDYLDQIRHVDVDRVAGGRRDPARVERLLRALARNTATEAAVSVIAADTGGADGPLARNTVIDLLAVLERMMVTEDQPAWAPHLRSRAILRSSKKRHFVDPSLAAAALGASTTQLLADLSLLGSLFESLVVRDLRILSQGAGGSLFHYRDNTGLEVDAIVQLSDGRWGAFEVKLGAGMVDRAAATLTKFADVVDTSRSGRPSVLAVITGNGYGYLRDDGIAVVPIGALAP